MEDLEEINAKLVAVNKEIDNLEKSISELKKNIQKFLPMNLHLKVMQMNI